MNRTISRFVKNTFAVTLPVLLLIVASSAAAQTTVFNPGCPVPFENLKSTGRPVDRCGIDGVGSTDSQHAQNHAKNNLCLTTPPVPIVLQDFINLQATVQREHIPFGSAQQLPDDRSVLHNIYKTAFGNTVGEGTLVKYVGYILNAHYSDVSDGESVNCKMLGKINNDIHITLSSTPTASPCQGIVAEIIPHLRPLAWEDIVTMPHTHPVLIVGQLFFDASHHPCNSQGKGSPPRISIWEIHPIYAIFVCKGTSSAECKEDNPQAWLPFDQIHPSSKIATDADYR